ncbi:hypothetical protein [Streptomyces sp. NPDC058665]|uniref:hypothetical protein n=1 Tax=Streptomyces sp. NPDC058665 TaxID=3346586 RepID=UPI0036621FDA
MSDSQVTIKLTSDEALVLSHWLEKLQMTDLSRVVDDPAVWAPIHRIAVGRQVVVLEDLNDPEEDLRSGEPIGESMAILDLPVSTQVRAGAVL